MLKQWRTETGKSQGECAASLGMRGGARTFQRIECGESSADADLVERIVRLTNGVVTAADMHEVRLAWLKANRPEKFPASDELEIDAARTAEAGSDFPAASQAGTGHSSSTSEAAA